MLAFPERVHRTEPAGSLIDSFALSCLRSGVVFFLFLAYPLLIFLSVRWQLPWLGMLALLAIGAHILWPALLRARPWAWLMILILATAGVWAVFSGDGRALAQLVPILIFLMLALFFGRTLMGDSLPLVTRIAAGVRNIPLERATQDMAPALLRYTRRVTVLWTGVFLILAGGNLLMLWLAPPLPWPYVVNAANFVIVIGLLGGEYLYHSRRYPDTEHNNFLDFIRDVAKFDYHSLLDD